MSVFICTKDKCPNNGIVYNFGDEQPARAECGGCHATLLPESE